MREVLRDLASPRSGLLAGWLAVAGPGLSTAIEPNGTVSVTDTGSGQFTYTVSGGTPYDGSYLVDPALLASGPINLVPPAIAGTPAVGQTATKTLPGLWLYDGLLGAVTITQAWPGGSTPDSFVIQPGDQGTSVVLIETATQAGVGARTAPSNALAIPAAPAATVVQDFSGGMAFALSITDGGYVSGTKTRTLSATASTNIFASWALNMVSGKTYRVRGTLAGTANVVFRFDEEINLNTAPHIDSRTINAGAVDFSFVYSGATGVRYCGLRNIPSIPATIQLVDFRVEELS